MISTGKKTIYSSFAGLRFSSRALDLKDCLKIVFIVLCVVSGFLAILLWGYLLSRFLIERGLTRSFVYDKLDGPLILQWREEEAQEPPLLPSNGLHSHTEVEVEGSK